MDPYLQEAIEEAKKGLAEGGIPIGSVIVHQGHIIGRGHNRRVQDNSVILHGEMSAFENAGRQPARVYRDCVLYTTLSPCPMCAGAIVMARIPRLVVGTRDPRTGACGSLWNIVCDPRLNHQVDIKFDVMEEECRKLLESFFRDLRSR